MNDIAKARSLKLTTTGRRSGRPHTVALWFVPHQVTALEPSVCVDIFSPPREEYR